MIIKFDSVSGKMEGIRNDERKAFYESFGFEIAKGENGKNYVKLNSVMNDILNISEGNEKVGNTICFNLPIEYTCSHCCECYLKGLCYAEQGCYNFADNQAKYSENLHFYNNHTKEQFLKALQLAIDTIGYKLFRYFTCGDIPNYDFIEVMVQLAKANPDIRFWSYTKKYSLCNRYVAENGGSIEKAFPENLVIIFSHWLNEDGSYYPMDNPYNFPTSEFIPFGKEKLAENATFICPCSDPTVNVTCETCEHKCYTLKPGQSQALCEHSTSKTKERDKALKAAKKALPKAEKKTA